MADLREGPQDNNQKQGKTKPLISVLIATYNSEKFISQCVSSILNQTLQSFEVIIVDDYSTDTTIDKIEAFRDHRIKVIKNTKNEGLTKSLNAGLARCSGMYIARIDSDDIAHHNRFELQIQHLEKNPHIGVLGSSIEKFKDDEDDYRVIYYPKENIDIKSKMFFYNTLAHPAVMIRANLLKKQGYDETIRKAQDYHLWSRLLYKTSFFNIQTPLIKYRDHTESITSSSSAEQKVFANRTKYIMIKELLPLRPFEDLILKYYNCRRLRKRERILLTLVLSVNLLLRLTTPEKSKIILNHIRFVK